MTAGLKATPVSRRPLVPAVRKGNTQARAARAGEGKSQARSGAAPWQGSPVGLDYVKISVVQSPPGRWISWPRAGLKSTKKRSSSVIPPFGSQSSLSIQDFIPG
jgi:hypothetical protein